MDRKARIREYKQTPRPAGVFAVRNTASGRAFVGVSTDLPAMLNRQRFQLEMGSHPNKSLQSGWRESGPDSFEFEVLDTLDQSDEPGADVSEDLATLQQMWLQSLRDSGADLYNSPATQGGTRT
jgi:hypothetical protein